MILFIIFMSGRLMASQHFLVVSYACSNQAHSVMGRSANMLRILSFLSSFNPFLPMPRHFSLKWIQIRVYSSMVEQVAFNYLVGSSNLPGPKNEDLRANNITSRSKKMDPELSFITVINAPFLMN